MIPSINIDNYTYKLPQERIAKYPLEQRDLSKLLVYNKGKITHKEFYKLPEVLPPDSVLIFNNSKVICARLLFRKETGATVEIFCLEPVLPVEYQQNFQSTSNVSWKCLVGNKKRWKGGELSIQININGNDISLIASFVKDDENEIIINFAWSNPKVTFGEILDAAGKMPIPPYLQRDAEELDKYRYQTIYSTIKGSVAAPTAGLHFTPRIFEHLEIKRIEFKELTLHVGAGTFKPVQTNDISQHLMHEETFTLNLNQLYFIRKHLGKIIAVGTTSTRLLESIYQMGVKLIQGIDDIRNIGQWEAYNQKSEISSERSIDALINYFEKENIDHITAKTSMIIIPGYGFKMIKGLITNFHMPRSTLLLLIAAFIGEDWKKVYQYALNNDFRFLSYGDGSVLLP